MRQQALGHRTVRYLRRGQGEPLLFLHGYGVHPRFYKPLIERLARHYEVFAPDLWRPGAIVDPPDTAVGCAEIVIDLCGALGLSECLVAGHSMGGAVGFTAASMGLEARRLVGINPALPVPYGRAGFMARSLVKSLRETTGLGGGWRGALFSARFHGPFFLDTARDLKGTARFMGVACGLSFDTIELHQPALVLFAERDEYFRLDPGLEADLAGALRSLLVKRLPKLNHDWPIFYPDLAADELHTFFSSPTPQSLIPKA